MRINECSFLMSNIVIHNMTFCISKNAPIYIYILISKLTMVFTIYDTNPSVGGDVIAL